LEANELRATAPLKASTLPVRPMVICALTTFGALHVSDVAREAMVGSCVEDAGSGQAVNRRVRRRDVAGRKQLHASTCQGGISRRCVLLFEHLHEFLQRSEAACGTGQIATMP